MLRPLQEIANFINTRDGQSKTLMLVAYPLSDGKPIYDVAWEWTVYFVLGVWRCPCKVN